MTHLIRILALMALLGACGNDRSGDLSSGVINSVQGLINPPEEVDVRAALTPEVLSQIDLPLTLVELETLDVVAVTMVFGRNQGHVTWQTADDVSFSFHSGVLNATRGLGNDLMSADIADTAAWIAQGGGTGQGVRIHRYLDGENQLFPRSFVCSYETVGAQPVEIAGRGLDTIYLRETCNATDLEIINRYWVGRDGFVWKSRQWVSPQVGYVQTERLIR